MKKNNKWLVAFLFIVVAFACGSGFAFWRSHKIPKEIVYTYSDTDVNLDNPCEVVGVKEYVFVAYVTETHDYFMENEKREFPESVKNIDNPCTECVVKVIKNIKGNLTEGETFSFYQMAGVTKDRKYIEMEENDLIPEIGKYYILSGVAHSDGIMTGGGKNGTIALESNITEVNLLDSEIYKKYLNAFENQIPPKNKSLYPNYLSVIDVNYGDGSYNENLKSNYQSQKAESRQAICT